MFHKQPIVPDPDKQYRLVTRSDMDGLVCAVLLKDLGICEDIKFVHPKDMQDGLVQMGSSDISTNLPYVPGVFLAFDHHDSEVERVEQDLPNHVIDANAKSAARVVYDYFGGKPAFPNVSEEMMRAVDKADAAQFDHQDILNPAGWDLLSFLMDSRTGLGRFRDFRISNYDLMMQLIDHCREKQDISEILALPDVKERVDLYKDHQGQFREQLIRCATVHGNLVVLDLRDEEVIFAGNRFVLYALFPKCNISFHVIWGRAKQNTVFAVGKSILDRSSQTDVGELMLQYGGGGHSAAGTCQVDNADAETVLQALISHVTNAG
ncbi:exopolyphosphatase [Cognatishimia sp. WU-CL00825]|uniref:exopolyphosphatase n=1 Tax=Cognatishimia sp. WU-CL00825 TaxID=3127658 RepID=UPI00310C0553